MQNLSKDLKLTWVAGAADGTSDYNSAAIDTAGFDSTLILARINTPAADNNFRLTDCDESAGQYADVEGSLLAGNGTTDDLFYYEVYRSQRRYLKLHAERGTTTVIDGFWVIQSRGRVQPNVNDVVGTLIGKLLASPAQGTA